MTDEKCCNENMLGGKNNVEWYFMIYIMRYDFICNKVCADNVFVQ